MSHGGMYDHLGFGFHRYSVDAKWHVPHFEKMLYDQAQLVHSYLDAYQATNNKTLYFAQVAQQVLDYVLRDMTSSNGAFYSAEDADSFAGMSEHCKITYLDMQQNQNHKTEGAFYVWTRAHVERALQQHASCIEPFCNTYHVLEEGNVDSASDPHGELNMQNVLFKTVAQDTIANDEDKNILLAKQILLQDRIKTRPRPHLDDKILTSWNGLMLGAFARASTVLKNDKYLHAAMVCANFLQKHHYVVQSTTATLYRTSRLAQTNTQIPAFLQDYAFLISGLLDLYEASANTSYLQWAYDLQLQQNALFLDKSMGDATYFETMGNDSTVLLRQKETYDGAEPSGTSIAVQNLIRLVCSTFLFTYF